MNSSRIFSSFFVLAACYSTSPAYSQTLSHQNTTQKSDVFEVQGENEGIVLGSPERAVRSLHEIYGLLAKFLIKNMGVHPTSSISLAIDLIKDPRYYGFSSYEESLPIFLNPDTRYVGADPNIRIAYSILTKRPDNSLIGLPKQKGTRDVWASTDIYYQINRGKVINNPVGFYVVLWDDGLVDKIPYDLVISIPEGQSLRRPFFPGQAGIPANALSYDDSFLLLPFGQTVPRGKPALNGQDKPVVDNGGPEAIVAISRRLNVPNSYGIDRGDLWKVFNPAKAEFTLSEVQVSAAMLHLDMQVKRQNLQQLQSSGTPALLFLQDDGRIVTLTSLDDSGAVIVDRGVTRIVDRNVLETRYSGESLVPVNSLTQQAAIVATDAVRSVQLNSFDDEVPQTFVLRNTGSKPVTLQLDYPLLGVTESKLSHDTLAPGETATLDLKVKWRSILKAPYQNVLVSLQTSDPVVPRLQLAILLNPPQAAAK